jgi:hypothetical protein
MSWIIERMDQGGGYVAKEGSRSSYTKRPDCARTFSTEAGALRNSCTGNEIAVQYFPGHF